MLAGRSAKGAVVEAKGRTVRPAEEIACTFPPVRRAALLLAAALLPAGARAGEPVESPRLTPEGPAARPIPSLDLPEWLGQVTGLSPAPRPEKKEEAPPGRLRLDLVPFVISNPLIGVGGGIAMAGAFRLGHASSTSFSSFALSGILTTNGQRGLNVRSQLRLPDNDWLLVGDWALVHWPGPAWGVGSDTPDSNETMVDRREVKFHETAFRRLSGPLYAGIGYFLDDEYDISDTGAKGGGPSAFSQYPYGTSGRWISSGFTANLLWEGRDNPVNPWKGFYALARLRLGPEEAGTDQAWQSVWVEERTYLPLGRANTLALWAYGWSAFGKVPWFSLPANGRDPEHRSGRGWIEARHVGKDLLGAEAEWRVAIWEFVSATAGVNVHAVSDRTSDAQWPTFPTWHPAAVAGLRLTLDRRSMTCLTLDGAVRPGGFTGYINFNEAF